MEFNRRMSNYLKIVDIRMVFKFMTMFLNISGIVRIVCEWFVGQERDTHVFMRPDLEMSFGLTNVGTIACTAREFVQ